VTTRFENITSQVDGVVDEFTVVSPYVTGTISIGYNGQLYPVGTNIAQEISTNRFKLSFVPTSDTHTLLAIYDDGNDVIQDPILMATALPPRTNI
jgi:hypothetical protein